MEISESNAIAPVRKTFRYRLELLEETKRILQRLGITDPVDNTGVAAAVILKDMHGEVIDLVTITNSFCRNPYSSHTPDDFVYGKIIANEYHAVVLEYDPATCTHVDEVLAAAQQLMDMKRVSAGKDRASVRIDGQLQEPITQAEFNVIVALLRFGTLSKKVLVPRSGVKRHPVTLDISTGSETMQPRYPQNRSMQKNATRQTNS